MNTGRAGAKRRDRNPRGHGDQLRADIIAAASELISESGDANQISLRGVAKKIGIAAPSIYRHFPDVEHLRMAVVERTFATFSEARDRAEEPASDPRIALLAGCHTYCEFALDHPGAYRFLFSHEAPRQSPAGAAAFHALAAAIESCQDAGIALAPDEPTQLAAQVWAALHGLVLLRMNAPGFPWPAPLEATVEQVVARLTMLTATQSEHDSQRTKRA